MLDTLFFPIRIADGKELPAKRCMVAGAIKTARGTERAEKDDVVVVEGGEIRLIRKDQFDLGFRMQNTLSAYGPQPG